MKLVKDTDQLNKKTDKISEEKAEEAIKTIIQWIGAVSYTHLTLPTTPYV